MTHLVNEAGARPAITINARPEDSVTGGLLFSAFLINSQREPNWNLTPILASSGGPSVRSGVRPMS